MIDLKFIEFYVRSLYDKSVEEYFHVERSTVSNWRNRSGMPKRYLLTFIDMEKSNNIFDLFERIYPKNNKKEMKNVKDVLEKNGYSVDVNKIKRDIDGKEVKVSNEWFEWGEKEKEDEILKSIDHIFSDNCH